MTYPHNRTPTEKEDLYFGKKVAKALRGEIKQRKPNSHEEADLHLAFCKWVRKEYPNDQFIRHEREGKRSPFMQNLFGIYNSDLDKMPDFELLEPSGEIMGNNVVWSEPNTMSIKEAKVIAYRYLRLYIEFKKPGIVLTLRDNLTIKTEYSEQYKRHVRFWEQNSPTYFCSSLEHAKEIFINYKKGTPLPMQLFNFKEENNHNSFFDNK